PEPTQRNGADSCRMDGRVEPTAVRFASFGVYSSVTPESATRLSGVLQNTERWGFARSRIGRKRRPSGMTPLIIHANLTGQPWVMPGHDDIWLTRRVVAQKRSARCSSAIFPVRNKLNCWI